MKSKWNGKSRGTTLGYKFFIIFIKYLGLVPTYWLLKTVSFYFYLFAGEPKRILAAFYQNHLNQSKENSEKLIRRNFYLLGQSLIDKVAFLAGKGDQITYTEEGEDYLKDLIERKEGAVLLSGHVGNWEIAGNLLKDLQVKVNLVMYDHEHQKIKNVLEKEVKREKVGIIPLKDDFSHVILIHRALKNGEFVCILADRFLENTPVFQLPFLNDKAYFPSGPFQLLEKLKSTYTFVFATKKEKFQYHFTATKPVKANKSAEQIATDFAYQLEQKVKQHPDHWFNYFDFFQPVNNGHS